MLSKYKVKGNACDGYIFGQMRKELCRPNLHYNSRDDLVTAIRNIERRFNDPNDWLNRGLENMFLGSHFDEGVRRGGKKTKVTC